MCSIRDWIEDHPKLWNGIKIFLKVVAVALSIYLIVAMIKRYQTYDQRGNYQLIVVGNSTNNSNNSYYMVRTGANVTNCSSSARFTTDISAIYYLVVGRTNVNFVILIVFWFNLAVSAVLMLLDIYKLVVLSVKYIPKCNKILGKTHQSSSETNKSSLILSLIDIIILKLWLMATISAPTYYVSAFDYSQVCLQTQFDAELIAMNFTVVAISFPILGMFGLCCAWGCTSCFKKKCVLSCGVRYIGPLITDNGAGWAQKLCLGYVLCQVASSVIFVFVAGGFLCILLLLKQATRADAIVIVANIFA